MQSFIDEYCVAFDEEDENKFEFTAIHNNFKKLVDELLSDILAEVEIQQEQFLLACSSHQQNKLHQSVINQIMSAEDFVAFKYLMTRRN